MNFVFLKWKISPNHTCSLHPPIQLSWIWFGVFYFYRSLSFCWRAPRGQLSGFCAEGAAPWKWESQWAPRRMSIWFDSTPLPSQQCLPLPTCISPEFSQPLERLHWNILYMSVVSFLIGELPLTCIEFCLYKWGWHSILQNTTKMNDSINCTGTGITLIPDMLMIAGSQSC